MWSLLGEYRAQFWTVRFVQCRDADVPLEANQSQGARVAGERDILRSGPGRPPKQGKGSPTHPPLSEILPKMTAQPKHTHDSNTRLQRKHAERPNIRTSPYAVFGAVLARRSVPHLFRLLLSS